MSNKNQLFLGSIIGLKKELEEQYIALHNHAFPEVLDRIHKSNIIMAIIGGAVWTPLMGFISDKTHSMALAFIIPIISYIFIIYYSFIGSKPSGPLYEVKETVAAD